VNRNREITDLAAGKGADSACGNKVRPQVPSFPPSPGESTEFPLSCFLYLTPPPPSTLSRFTPTANLYLPPRQPVADNSARISPSRMLLCVRFRGGNPPAPHKGDHVPNGFVPQKRSALSTGARQRARTRGASESAAALPLPIGFVSSNRPSAFPFRRATRAAPPVRVRFAARISQHQQALTPPNGFVR
jgi:hypothetical protein